ncbi:hypothetical protein V8E53_012008 [Lactarius tabidus]
MNTASGAPTHLFLLSRLRHGYSPELSQPRCPIESSSGRRTDKFQRCISQLTRARSPVNGNTVMHFLSMRRAVSRLLKRIRFRKNHGFNRHDSLSALTAVRSQSDSVQLCLVLGCGSVSERDFFPSPRKKWSLVLSEFSFYLFLSRFTSSEIENSTAESRPIMEGKTKDAQLRDESGLADLMVSILGHFETELEDEKWSQCFRPWRCRGGQGTERSQTDTVHGHRLPITSKRFFFTDDLLPHFLLPSAQLRPGDREIDLNVFWISNG